jgi:hypothetical protein
VRSVPDERVTADWTISGSAHRAMHHRRVCFDALLLDGSTRCMYQDVE